MTYVNLSGFLFVARISSFEKRHPELASGSKYLIIMRFRNKFGMTYAVLVIIIIIKIA